MGRPEMLLLTAAVAAVDKNGGTPCGCQAARARGSMPKSEQVRLLTNEDLPLVERLLSTSEYIYQRFTLEELPTLLKHYPSVGIFSGASLRSFLLSQMANAPSAWIGGFGVS